MLKGYKRKVKGFVYDTSYFDDKKPIMLSTYGMLFARLLGLHLVYKF